MFRHVCAIGIVSTMATATWCCSKVSFKGTASPSTEDASSAKTPSNQRPGSAPAPNGGKPSGPRNDVDDSDIGMDGKFDPNDPNDPDNPASPNNPYHPDFKPKGPDGGRAEACTVGDRIDFSWKGAEKECIVDQGKTFHFDRNLCLDLKVTKFSCDWKTLISKLDSEGIKVTDKIRASVTNGSKLITCGEVRQANRVRFIVQWIKVEDISTIEGCEAGGSSNPAITTGCYTHWLDRPQPPEPANEDERRQRVYQCLDEL